MSEDKTPQRAPETDSVDIHDRVAEAYYGLMGPKFMRDTQNRIHWICREILGKTVLDVGCSQGIMPILLAREGLKVIGIDSSPKAIDEAKRYLASEPKQVRKNVSFVNSDFLSWDFQGLKIDTVVMSEVLEHLTRPNCFIEAAARILANRGRLIVTVPFGINDFIDHKHTFYLLKPLRLISKHFDFVDIEVLGNWLGVVADRRVGADRGVENFRPTIALMEKLESAFYQTERGLRDELSLARAKQDEANRKYRGATEQITALKQRVTQEEQAHQAAKQTLTQTTTQPKQTQVMAEGQAKTAATDDATKSLLRLEAELAATRSKLEEANQKYRGAGEQITALKQQLAQVTAEGQAKQVAADEAAKKLLHMKAELEEANQKYRGAGEQITALKQQLAQVTAEGQAKQVAADEAAKKLLHMKAELEEANQKYRGAGEQITALEQRVMQEESARQAAEQALAQASTLLEETQSYIQKERVALQQQLAQVMAEGQAKQVAADEAAKKLLRLDAELEGARSKLGEANQKYRGASEQITALKQQLAQVTAEGPAKQAAADEAAKKLLRLEAELEGARSKLGEANQKYRGATEQVTVLKQRVTEEEAARQTAEQGLAQVTTQLEQTQSRLQAEQVAADEAAKNLLRLDAELEEARSKLGEANQKYRGATEQVTVLKQRVTEEEAARQTAEQGLAQVTTQLEQTQSRLQAEQVAADEAAKNLLRLDAELEEARSKLGEANQKYRGATEQVTVLKQRVTEEEAARQTAEQAKQVAADEAAKKLLRLDAELEEARSKLGEANQKYRGATEQVTALKQRAAEEETARQTAEQALVQATTQLEQSQSHFQKERAVLQQQLVQLTAEGQAKRVAVQETEGNLLRLETELEEARSKLREASQKYRGATEQVTALKQRVADEETARQTTEQALAQATTQLEQAQSYLQAEHAALLEQVAQLSQQEQASGAAAAETTKNLLRLDAELEEARSKLGEASQKYRGATEQMTALKQRVTEEETARRTAEQAQAQVTTQLEQANCKYRQLTAEQIPELKRKLETQYSKAREGQHALEQLRLELQTNRKALAETTRELEKTRQQKVVAVQQLEKTRATISFQTGYQLIHGFKSMNSVLRLPSALWALRKEATQRRKKKAFVPRPLELSALSQPSPKLPPQPSFIFRPNVFTEPLQEELPSNWRAISTVVTEARPSQALHAALPAGRLTMACIMDEFTLGSFQPEARLEQLTPSDWRAELEAAQPDLLFVESAWRGKDDLWGNKVGHTSTELQGIVDWCRGKHIPSVFWCKEDPIHFETFLTTAKLFDYVFTTDIDCIHRYKAALGHDRVYLLPFACQPATTNPIEMYARKDAFCFAGAYYVRYPERTRDLGDFVLELPLFRPLEIYDRNYGKNDPNYQFPEEYRPYIVGTLPFDQIEKAYKGYRYAINLNSIKQSQSMFARRVFELLASNTITISNFSRGLRLLFGDLVVTSDNGHEIVRRLNKLADNDAHSRKFRLAGLRKVMSEHTYAQRLAYVVAKVSGKVAKQSLPHIAVLAHAENQRELDGIQANYQRQRYSNTALYVVVGDGIIPPVREEACVHVVTSVQAQDLLVGGLASQADLVAGMVAEDYYGPHYLTDIALATRYTQADLIGKAARYTWAGGQCQLRHPDDAYHPVQRLPARAAAIRRQGIANEPVLAWVQSLGTCQLHADQGLAIDEFNYCEQGATADSELIKETVDDLPGLQTGLSIEDLLKTAERIAPEPRPDDASPRLTGAQLANDFGKKPSAAITLEVEGANWRVSSTLPDGKHDYVYATADHRRDELGFTDQVKVYFDVTPGLNVQLVVLFLDAQKQKISHVMIQANRNQDAGIPPGTERIRFGLRIYAGGHADIQGLVLGHRNLQPVELIGQAEQLLLTNQYPSYSDLYRNAFVHSRVRAYHARGVRCDVFRLRPDEAVSYHEFEDINVISGSQEVLHRMLASGRYKSVLVHFLDEAMWQVLQHHIDRVQVVVWIHGAEIQPWHRRDNFENERQRDVAKSQSKARMTFWRGLLRQMPDNLKLVFVSKYLAEVTMEDLGFRLPDSQYRLIHNAIDTDLFAHRKKSVEQRRKILSIRPYASRTYANDLSVKAILELSRKPYFGDLEFRMIGDGKLFDEVLAPLRGFSNVYIEQRFLTHVEIAAIHREYGIFLCPSRMDTQGVSRDEAMSSGLVPVTNSVGAIPEFVDETCGFLARPEDSAGLAESIAKLYESPELFSAMSAAAAGRVRMESSCASTIDLELTLFNQHDPIHEQSGYRLKSQVQRVNDDAAA